MTSNNFPFELLQLIYPQTAPTNNMNNELYKFVGPISMSANCKAGAYILDGALFIVAEMPGLNPGDFSIIIKDNIVSLEGDTEAKFKEYNSKLLAATKKVGGFSERPYKVQIDADAKLQTKPAETSYENGMVLVKILLDLDLQETSTFTF